MNKLKILGILLFSSFPFLTGMTSDSETARILVQESLWKGFKRHDFTFEQRNARLIIPEESLPGNPWVWRARFPDWHTEADSILVSWGYHIAYVNTNDMFGSPNAISVWDRFYLYLTERYHLHEKVALSGVSRGGLFIYNWAKLNAKKVCCIYAEAPVCDIKSWPAGFGKGKGSPDIWKKLKEEYGFSSDDEARAYLNNPIDGLEPLAAKKIPVLHMIGLEDKIVPPEENTFILADRYVKLGGIVTMVPCTSGKQNLEGHHFPIETPGRVADFIQYHFQRLALNMSDSHRK
jgi:sialidase-1